MMFFQFFKSLNNILYSNDPNQIPLTDFNAAADLPYDTYIPAGNFNFNKYFMYKTKEFSR